MEGEQRIPIRLPITLLFTLVIMMIWGSYVRLFIIEIDLLRIDKILMRLPAEMQQQHKEQSVSLGFIGLPGDENALLALEPLRLSSSIGRGSTFTIIPPAAH